MAKSQADRDDRPRLLQEFPGRILRVSVLGRLMQLLDCTWQCTEGGFDLVHATLHARHGSCQALRARRSCAVSSAVGHIKAISLRQPQIYRKHISAPSICWASCAALEFQQLFCALPSNIEFICECRHIPPMGHWYSIYHEALLVRLASMAVVLSCWCQCSGSCSATASGWQRASPGHETTHATGTLALIMTPRGLAQTHRSIGLSDKRHRDATRRQTATSEYVGFGGQWQPLS